MALASTIFSRWDGVSDRLPATLAGLRGPDSGVVVLPELPHTATGKLLKTSLRARFKDYYLKS